MATGSNQLLACPSPSSIDVLNGGSNRRHLVEFLGGLGLLGPPVFHDLEYYYYYLLLCVGPGAEVLDLDDFLVELGL